MDVRFAPPQVRALDEASAELCACAIFADERPMKGIAGLCDWRLSGKLSALAKSDYLTGRAGEVVMVPGRPRLPFDKVLVFGLGERQRFDEDGFVAWLERVWRTMGGLHVRRALIEIAGREVLPTPRRAELMAEAPLVGPESEGRFVFIDDEDSQRALVHAMKRRELRVRSA